MLPAIGLVHFPFFAARISAYRAGLIPFFLHLLISASDKVLMSKSLALHLLLPLDFDPGLFRSASSSIECSERCSSLGDEVDPDRVNELEDRLIDVDFSMTRRAGLGGLSCVLSDSFRGIIFRNND